jgi:hypothetical protein
VRAEEQKPLLGNQTRGRQLIDNWSHSPPFASSEGGNVPHRVQHDLLSAPVWVSATPTVPLQSPVPHGRGAGLIRFKVVDSGFFLEGRV